MTRDEINERIIMLLEKYGLIPPETQEETESSSPEHQTSE